MPTSSETSSSTRFKLWGALVVFIAAGAIGYYQFYSAGPASHVDAEASIKVTCSQCKEVFDMPFAKYHSLSPDGTDVGGAIVCPKCGAKALTRMQPNATPAAPDPDAEPTFEEKPAAVSAG